MDLQAASVPNAADGIADCDLRIGEVPAAPRTEMPPMWVNAEPVLIEMCVPAVGTFNVAHRVPKNRRHHVVDGVKLRNENPLHGKAPADETNRTNSAVQFLLPVLDRPCVYMDSSIHRQVRRIVNGWDRTPESDAALVLIKIEPEDILCLDWRQVRRSTSRGALTVLCGRVRFVCKTPIPRTTIPSLTDGHDLTLAQRPACPRISHFELVALALDQCDVRLTVPSHSLSCKTCFSVSARPNRVTTSTGELPFLLRIS